jgi:hypothetical protein
MGAMPDPPRTLELGIRKPAEDTGSEKDTVEETGTAERRRKSSVFLRIVIL